MSAITRQTQQRRKRLVNANDDNNDIIAWEDRTPENIGKFLHQHADGRQDAKGGQSMRALLQKAQSLTRTTQQESKRKPSPPLQLLESSDDDSSIGVPGQEADDADSETGLTIPSVHHVREQNTLPISTHCVTAGPPRTITTSTVPMEKSPDVATVDESSDDSAVALAKLEAMVQALTKRNHCLHRQVQHVTTVGAVDKFQVSRVRKIVKEDLFKYVKFINTAKCEATCMHYLATKFSVKAEDERDWIATYTHVVREAMNNIWTPKMWDQPIPT